MMSMPIDKLIEKDKDDFLRDLRALTEHELVLIRDKLIALQHAPGQTLRQEYLASWALEAAERELRVRHQPLHA